MEEKARAESVGVIVRERRPDVRPGGVVLACAVLEVVLYEDTYSTICL